MSVNSILANLSNFTKKKKIYDKNDSWGTYIAEGVKSGAFSIYIVWYEFE